MGYIHIALSSHEKEVLQKTKRRGEEREMDEEEKKWWCEAIRKPM